MQYLTAEQASQACDPYNSVAANNLLGRLNRDYRPNGRNKIPSEVSALAGLFFQDAATTCLENLYQGQLILGEHELIEGLRLDRRALRKAKVAIRTDACLHCDGHDQPVPDAMLFRIQDGTACLEQLFEVKLYPGRRRFLLPSPFPQKHPTIPDYYVGFVNLMNQENFRGLLSDTITASRGQQVTIVPTQIEPKDSLFTKVIPAKEDVDRTEHLRQLGKLIIPILRDEVVQRTATVVSRYVQEFALRRSL